MEEEGGGSGRGGSLSARLAQLAGRRGAYRAPDSSSSEDEQPPPLSEAAQALRQLLSGAAADMQALQQDMGVAISPRADAAEEAQHMRLPTAASLPPGPAVYHRCSSLHCPPTRSGASTGSRPATAGSARAGSRPHSAAAALARRPPSAAARPRSRPATAGAVLLPRPSGGRRSRASAAEPEALPPLPTARRLIALEAQVASEQAAAEVERRARDAHQAGRLVQEAAAQRAELDALLSSQLADAAERQRAREAREAALLGMQEEAAREHLAAGKTPALAPARRRAVAAAIAIQAAWRGAASRSATAALAQRRRLLRELRAAAEGGSLGPVLTLASALEGLGEGTAARQLVSGFEQRAAEAAQALSAAAASGSSEEFRQAEEAAQRFGHLAEAAARAREAFGARSAAARDGVLAAAQGGTLVQLREAAARAAALGVDPALLRQAEEGLAARNARAVAALRAALEAAPFDATRFGACLEQARGFGLLADVARAQWGLQLRAGRAAAAAAAAGASGAAADVEAACAEAAALGLQAEAAAARGQLARRLAEAEAALWQVTEAGALTAFEPAAHLAEQLGAGAALLASCRQRLGQRQGAAERALQEAARGGGMVEFRASRQAALELGLAQAATEALAAVETRRQAGAQHLAARTRAVCDAVRSTGATAAELDACAGILQQLSRCPAGGRRARAELLCASTLPGSVRLGGAIAAWAAAADAAAALELGRQVGAAADTLRAYLSSALSEARMPVLVLGPGVEAPGDVIQQRAAELAPALAADPAAADAPPPPSPAEAALAAFQRWQRAQQPVLAALDALSQGQPDDGSDADGGRGASAGLLELSNLQALHPGGAPLGSLDLSAQGLASLDGLAVLSTLTALTALSLAGNHLAGVAPLAHLTRLERLSLEGNRLEGLASLPLLPALRRLDVLAASDNRLAALPPDLDLPFLRELWLSGNAIAKVAAWPWLPSLQALHLQGNALARLAPLTPLSSLTCVDLSVNALPSLGACLAGLAGLLRLRRLLLHDNAFREPGEVPYADVVGRALPSLEELDGEPIPEARRRRYQRHAERHPTSSSKHGGGSGGRGGTPHREDGAWEAATVAWAVAGPEAATLARAHARQQHPLPVASQQHELGSSRGGSSSSRGSGRGSSRGSSSIAGFVAGLAELGSVPDAAVGADGGTPAGGRESAAELLARYRLLATAPPSALQGLVLVNSEYFRRLHDTLTQAATAIQRRWRGAAARARTARLADERAAARRRGAAAAIQAAWRGHAARRRTAWLRPRLDAWRMQWREAQALLEMHQRHRAATRVQAAWRGWRARRLLARARAAVGDRRSSLDAEPSEELDCLLPDGAAIEQALDGLERLQPELARSDSTALLGAGLLASLPHQRQQQQQSQQHCVQRPGGVAFLTGSSSGSQGSLPGLGQLPGGGEAAAAAAAAAAGPDSSDWQFESAATAAAFAQLRQRQQAQARRREVREALRDPEARLRAFHHRGSSGAGMLGGAAAEAAAGHRSRRGSRHASSASSQGSSVASGGGACSPNCSAGGGAASPPRRCGLPPLRDASPKLAALPLPPSVLAPFGF
eukprot:scaffold5.g905.t1